MQRRAFTQPVTVGLLSLLVVCATGVSWAAEQFPYLAEVTRKGINVRSGQSQNFEQVPRLQRGERVVVVGQSFSWSKIKLPIHAEAYISTEYVRPIRDQIGEVTGNRVNIRAGAGTGHGILGQMNKRQLVRIQKKEGEWYKIEPVDQSYGWVKSDFLKFQTNKVPEPRVVQLPTRNIYTQKRLAAAEEARKRAAQEARRLAEESERRKSLKQAVGVVEDLGEHAVSAHVRHKLVVDDKTAYFLEGYRHVIDGFLHNKVSIEGKLNTESQAAFPVLLVTRINLVL